MDSGGEPLRGGDLADELLGQGGDGGPARAEWDPVDDRPAAGTWTDGRDGLTAVPEPAVGEAAAADGAWPADPGRFPRRVGHHRGARRPWLGFRRTAGNLLISCTGADHRAVGERDRSRFASAGALMLLTAGLATYAGASVASFGFGISMLAALPYGLFYALFIFFIDRSVLLTIRPMKATGKGDKRDVRLRRGLPTGAIRIFIAITGAILIGESLLLRFFDSSITPRVAELRQEQLAGVLAAWDAGQRETEQRLTADVADRRAELAAAENLVTTKTDEVNCQLAGGNGCVGGRGPIYEVKLEELRRAAARVPELRAERDAAQARLDEFNTTRDQRRAEYADAQWQQIQDSNDLLIREKAFWRLTAEDNSVKVWRLLISLLILGIDLAPLMFKRSLDRTAYARAERAALWDGETSERVDAYQLDRNAQARRGRAGTVADRMAARYEEYALAREELRLAAALDEDSAATSLRRDERWLGHDRQAADLRRAHRLPSAVPAPAPPPADNS